MHFLATLVPASTICFFAASEKPGGEAETGKGLLSDAVKTLSTHLGSYRGSVMGLERGRTTRCSPPRTMDKLYGFPFCLLWFAR